jgi:hypothetical protein
MTSLSWSLEIKVADTEMMDSEGWEFGDDSEQGCDEEVVSEILDVVRRWLLVVVPISLPSFMQDKLNLFLFHICSLVSGPTQKRSGCSSSLPSTFSNIYFTFYFTFTTCFQHQPPFFNINFPFSTSTVLFQHRPPIFNNIYLLSENPFFLPSPVLNTQRPLWTSAALFEHRPSFLNIDRPFWTLIACFQLNHQQPPLLPIFSPFSASRTHFSSLSTTLF